MWRPMGLMGDRERSGRRGKTLAFCSLAMALWGLIPIAAPVPARAVELSAPVAALYSTVSIFPPPAHALTQILAAGRASAAAERAAVQKAVVWFDRRMGPVIGTDKRVAKADFRYFDDKHNYDCWDTTRNTTSLLLVLQQWGLLRYHVVGDPHYRGNALVLQTPHNTAVLVDRATKVEWVVDMWSRGYLQPPDVMTGEKWATED